MVTRLSTITHDVLLPITLFIPITVLRGTDNIPCNILLYSYIRIDVKMFYEILSVSQTIVDI